jgi:hypothetical protein
MLLQAMAYKVLGIRYEREHTESNAYHFARTLSLEKALTTTPISADDYRRVLLDAVDEKGHYVFRDIQIEVDASRRMRVIYVADDLFSVADADFFKKVILEVFNKNRGVGELSPTIFAAKAVNVEFTFTLDLHADKLGQKGGLPREYNLVLATVDRALRPPPERDSIVDVSLLEGPEVTFPNITEFKDAVKFVDEKVCLVKNEWNRVEKSRIEKSHEELVGDRLAAAKEEIEGFSFVSHFAVTSGTLKIDVPADASEGDYFYYRIAKAGTPSATTALKTIFQRQNNPAVPDVDPEHWRIAPISKRNNKVFRVSDAAVSAEGDAIIPTLFEMMPPAYRDDGGPQWKELLNVFDEMLEKIEERDKQIFSFFDELEPGKSKEQQDLSFVDWLLHRVGGGDISSIFKYHIAHTDVSKRTTARDVQLRKFLPAILDTMQTRNLARYPGSPLSALLWFAVGEGWSGWRDLKIIVLDHSHFINGFVGTAPDYLKPLHVDLITNFGNIYADPDPAIKQFTSIVKNVMPMHLSWRLVDIDTMSVYAAADKEYRSETERYNAKEGFKSVYDKMPDQLAALLSGPVNGVKRYSQHGQLRY